MVAGTRTAQGGWRIGAEEEEDAAAGVLKRGKRRGHLAAIDFDPPRQTPAAGDAVAPTQTTASASSYGRRNARPGQRAAEQRGWKGKQPNRPKKPTVRSKWVFNEVGGGDGLAVAAQRPHLTSQSPTSRGSGQCPCHYTTDPRSSLTTGKKRNCLALKSFFRFIVFLFYLTISI